ncbi:MAG: cyclophilin-like fold protein [Gammaproteobacteria bacterium]
MQNNKIIFKVGPVELIAHARDTPTAHSILNALPIQSTVQTWGEEVYFSIPVQSQLESDAREVVNLGEIAFWVEGSCIAIGFGPTPISQNDEIRLAAATNIWADAEGDVRELINAHSQDTVSVDWYD